MSKRTQLIYLLIGVAASFFWGQCWGNRPQLGLPAPRNSPSRSIREILFASVFLVLPLPFPPVLYNSPQDDESKS